MTCIACCLFVFWLVWLELVFVLCRFVCFRCLLVVRGGGLLLCSCLLCLAVFA